MDWIRSPYEVDVRFWRNDPLKTRIRWFFTKESALQAPTGGPFVSSDWDTSRTYIDPAVGEDGKQGYDPDHGANPVGYLGFQWCGPDIAWQEGGVHGRDPEIVTDAYGRSTCCFKFSQQSQGGGGGGGSALINQRHMHGYGGGGGGGSAILEPSLLVARGGGGGGGSGRWYPDITASGGGGGGGSGLIAGADTIISFGGGGGGGEASQTPLLLISFGGGGGGGSGVLGPRLIVARGGGGGGGSAVLTPRLLVSEGGGGGGGLAPQSPVFIWGEGGGGSGGEGLQCGPGLMIIEAGSPPTWVIVRSGGPYQEADGGGGGGGFADQGDDVPLPGTIIMYASTSAPAGYVACDGSSKLRSAYPDLFAAIGTTFGAADGSHFNVPDLRGRVPVGQGTGSGLTTRNLNDSGGLEAVTLLAGESGIRDHTHGPPSGKTLYLTDGATLAGAVVTPLYGSAAATGGVSGGAQPAVTAHENMQPWQCAVTYFIKY